MVQGELRIYKANGDIMEIRPVGSYVAKQASDEPHTQGGGDQDVIASFSNRGTDGVIYEILDDNLNTLANLGLHDFNALLEAQGPQLETT